MNKCVNTDNQEVLLGKLKYIIAKMILEQPTLCHYLKTSLALWSFQVAMAYMASSRNLYRQASIDDNRSDDDSYPKDIYNNDQSTQNR